jgi:hypothetical protein
MSLNGMVRPCSCPASGKLARGGQTRSTLCPQQQHRMIDPRSCCDNRHGAAGGSALRLLSAAKPLRAPSNQIVFGFLRKNRRWADRDRLPQSQRRFGMVIASRRGDQSDARAPLGAFRSWLVAVSPEALPETTCTRAVLAWVSGLGGRDRASRSDGSRRMVATAGARVCGWSDGPMATEVRQGDSPFADGQRRPASISKPLPQQRKGRRRGSITQWLAQVQGGARSCTWSGGRCRSTRRCRCARSKGQPPRRSGREEGGPLPNALIIFGRRVLPMSCLAEIAPEQSSG